MKLSDRLLRSRPVRTCKVCSSPDKCDFKAPDDTWKTVVPMEYQNAFVCVECFGKFACEKQIKLFQVHKLLWLPLINYF
jgi:hypothetical protein